VPRRYRFDVAALDQAQAASFQQLAACLHERSKGALQAGASRERVARGEVWAEYHLENEFGGVRAGVEPKQALESQYARAWR